MYSAKKFVGLLGQSGTGVMFCRCQQLLNLNSTKSMCNKTVNISKVKLGLQQTSNSFESCVSSTKPRNFFSTAKRMPSVDEEFRHLNYTQLNDLTIKGNSIIIDVREKDELDETGIIPGSHHIPLGEIERALSAPADDFEKIYNFKKPSPVDPLVFSCRSGRRSLVALEKALAQGFTNAKHYSGGWLDWAKNSEQK